MRLRVAVAETVAVAITVAKTFVVAMSRLWLWGRLRL